MKVIRGKKTDRKSGETHRVIRKSNLVAVGIIGMLGICMLSGCSLADKEMTETDERDFTGWSVCNNRKAWDSYLCSVRNRY